MKLHATDTLHLSELGPHVLEPGDEFEVSDAVGKELLDRRLASEGKKAPAPANKMAAAPANKSGEPKAKVKA